MLMQLFGLLFRNRCNDPAAPRPLRTRGYSVCRTHRRRHSGSVDVEDTRSLSLVAITALILTFSLWWSYFAHAKDRLEAAIEAQGMKNVTNLMRDVFSMLHIPMIMGLVAIAVAIEEAIGHPDAVIHTEVRIALGVGILMFVAGMGLAIKRAGCALPVPRVVISVITAVEIVFVDGVDAYITILIGLIGLIAIAVFEHIADSSAASESPVEMAE